MKKTFIFILFPFFVNAQTGGSNTFQFLDLVASPQAAALGGSAIATPANNVSLFWQNPALLSSAMNNHISLAFTDYFDGINYGQVAYSKSIREKGNLGITFHYINYGSFTLRDEAANDLGSFSAGEYALQLAWSKALDSLFYIGVALKPVFSDLETYTAFGLAADAGVYYLSEDKNFAASLVAVNAGRQLTGYSESGNEGLPFQMQAGFTKKLPRAPFRFGITWQHLEKFDLTYEDPSASVIDPLTGEENDNKINFFDKALRHLIINTEILITENFNVRLGYNAKRRSELSVESRRGLVGFTGGFGIKISKFRLDYARTNYYIKQGANQFSVGVRLADFKKK